MGKNMSAFDIPDLDDATENEWRAFAAELADLIAGSEPGAVMSIRPEFLPEGVVDRAMLIRSTTAGTVVCAASGLASPDQPWRSTDVATIHVLEEDASWVDRFAASLVSQIREIWNVPHPSFLLGWKPEPSTSQLPKAGRTVSVAVDESALGASVGEALTAQFGDEVEFSDAGFHVTTGFITTTVYVAGDDEVRIHACLVERIAGRTRAAEVVADLNRRHPRTKFLLVEDRVHVAVSVDARPFVPEHLINAVERVTAFASTVDVSFADNLGGVVATSGAYTVQEDELDPGEDVPLPVLTLLEIDAESGSVDVQDVIAACGPDHGKIAAYEAFCSEQAESWRDFAQEARERGEMDVAINCDREAIPWDRMVRALRAALRTVGFFDKA